MRRSIARHLGIGKTESDGNDENFENDNFSCTVAVTKSDPPQVQSTCKVKLACVANGTYEFPLNAEFLPIDGDVSVSRHDKKEPAAQLTYDSEKHSVMIPWQQCDTADILFTVSYKGEMKDASAGTQKLYKHPCGNFDAMPVSCDSAGGFVDLPLDGFKTCDELGLKEGDTCPAGLGKCIFIQQQACKDTPTVKASSAHFLHCSEKPIENVNCPP